MLFVFSNFIFLRFHDILYWFCHFFVNFCNFSVIAFMFWWFYYVFVTFQIVFFDFLFVFFGFLHFLICFLWFSSIFDFFLDSFIGLLHFFNWIVGAMLENQRTFRKNNEHDKKMTEKWQNNCRKIAKTQCVFNKCHFPGVSWYSVICFVIFHWCPSCFDDFTMFLLCFNCFLWFSPIFHWFSSLFIDFLHFLICVLWFFSIFDLLSFFSVEFCNVSMNLLISC